MQKYPPLKSLEAFEAAARNQSFLKASEELFLTPSAISHQIKILEDYLGVKLFNRTHRSVQLTEVGKLYAKEITKTFNYLYLATRDIELLDKSDVLTIQSTPSFATQWLMPRLARFAALYNDIDVRINASTHLVDISKGEADVAIRYGEVLPEQGVIIENLGEESFCVLCSPFLLTDGKSFTLSNQTLIHSEINMYRWKDWKRDYYMENINLDRGLRFDRTFMSIHAAVDGLGVALESTLMAEREILNGQLILPLGTQGKTLNTHKLTYSKYKAASPKVKIFREWLFDELSQSLTEITRYIQ